MKANETLMDAGNSDAILTQEHFDGEVKMRNEIN